MEEFTISAGTDLVRISIANVNGFPDRTSYFGGYDVEGKVDIRCSHYYVRGDLSFSTGEVWQFSTELQKAYNDLSGQARFCSSEGNLDFTSTFGKRGHWILEGTFRQYVYENTRLIFEMGNDQSYLIETLAELARFVARYGDNRGVHQ